MREPCATKTRVLCGTSYATKTLHKTFIRKKSYAGLMRVLGLLREVLCGSYADLLCVDFLLHTVVISPY